MIRRPALALGAALAVVSPLAAAQPTPDRAEVARRLAEDRQTTLPSVEVLDPQVLLSRGVRDVGDALATLPGVHVLELADGRRQLVVDGMLQRTLLCVDGRAVLRAPDGRIDLGELPGSLEQVARVELVRASMSHVYGAGAEGGVLNIVTRRLQRNRASATAMVRALPGGVAAGRFSAQAAYAGARGGVYTHADVGSHPSVEARPGLPSAARRTAGVALGGAFRLHPRVLARLDTVARDLEVQANTATGPQPWRTRRATAVGELVVRAQGNDTLRVELRTALLQQRRWPTGAGPITRHGYEQGAALRYAGEPVGGHLVQLEGGLLGELATTSGEPDAGAWRVRGFVGASDRWNVSQNFALEGALRVESTQRLQPAFAPSLGLRYQPFAHVVVRAGVASGYRYAPLLPDDSTLPQPWTTTGNGSTDHESSRQVRAGVVWQPDAHFHLAVDGFRTELSGGALALNTGALALGASFGQSQAPGRTFAHLQGLSAHMSGQRLRGGVSVDVGYNYMQEAQDDLAGKRLPWVARHQVNARAVWAPDFLGGGLQVAVEALMDRVDQAGGVMPAQGLVHLGVFKRLGPLELVCVLDNAMNVTQAEVGPREGRSARCLARAGM